MKFIGLCCVFNRPQMTQIRQIYTDFKRLRHRKKSVVILFNLCHLCAISHSLFTTSAGFSFAARHTRQPMHKAISNAIPAKITRYIQTEMGVCST